VRIIDSAGAQVKLLEGAKDFMNTLSATKAGNLLVAGGEDGVLHVWDVGTGRVVGKFGN
jgi:WD40 repeat protein